MLSLLSCLFVLLAAGIPGSLGFPQARGEIKPSLSILARINTTGFANLVEVDQARAQYLRSGSLATTSEARNFRRTSSFSVQNAGVTYTANVGVGSPPTFYTLIIDTGSSNTWVGAGKTYVKTKTSKPTGQPISVTYGSGSFSGQMVVDTVELSPALVIPGQLIGVADQSQSFEGVDGILGIGPVDLTEGTTPAPTVPTVTDNLLAKGTIVTESIGIFFAPGTANPSTGELTFGGIDTSKTLSDVHFVPLTKTPPASLFWGIDQSISYGTITLLKSNAGIVDTGTTLILLATDAFSIYQKATGAVFDPVTGLLKIKPPQFKALKPLDFHIGERTFSLSPNAQIWPRTLNADIGGDPNDIYLVVADLGSPSGQGFDFIDGYALLERFYTVYDTTNNQVGFAPTAFTNATTN